MFFSTLSLGLVLLPFVSATIHDVQVGKDGLSYTPRALSAVAGDQVVFHFHGPSNHTVTQSSFADPCGKKEGGLNSGFMPVAANDTSMPTFTVEVKDETPTWFYCAQAAGTPKSHCGAGMVFGLNCGKPPAANDFDHFLASAKAVGAALNADVSSSPAASTTASASSAWTTVYSSAAAPATTAGAAAAVHTVVVGGPSKLLFTPNTIVAAAGDMVVFEFHEKNHTVTESTFASPCTKKNVNGVAGFASGFIPVASDATSFPTFNYTVKDTTPVWAYCAQAAHCGAGMVFSINPVETSEKNMDAFVALAKSINGTAAAASPSATAAAALSGASKRIGGGFTVGVVFALLSVVLV